MPIDGLFVVRDFVSEDEEAQLLEVIGKTPRAPGPERNRIERYGPGVIASGYSSGTLVKPQIPPHLAWLCDRLVGQLGLRQAPNAITINEYLVGQYLGLHTDMDKAGVEISTLGILGDAEMLFQYGGDPAFVVRHPRRALIRMRGPCRRAPWRHGIMPVAADRISIVFRRGELA